MAEEPMTAVPTRTLWTLEAAAKMCQERTTLLWPRILEVSQRMARVFESPLIDDLCEASDVVKDVSKELRKVHDVLFPLLDLPSIGADCDPQAHVAKGD